MSLRNYNKLLVHTDREEGSEKILLGYKNDLRESILYKDKETYFHIPFYTETLLLNESNLIANGATGGPFPAASDRIFKSLKGYGSVSPDGTPSDVTDGGWFCSWLYKDENGKLKWMDRFYNPGQFSVTIAAQQLEEGPPYITHNPVFRDVPSNMKFESGVLYKYFHVGENAAANIVGTYAGLTGERLPLNIVNWGSNNPDASYNNFPVKITTTASDIELYSKASESTEHIYAPSISFDHNKELEIQVEYNSSYGQTDEFTLAFWTHSNNWFDCQSTQLVGNYTSKGGFGIFIDTLSSFPFFVIPETGYGHLLFVNEKLNPFLDQSVQYNTQLTATPKLIGIDSEQNVIACFDDDSRYITKYNNVGEILNFGYIPEIRDLNKVPIEGNQLIQLLCGVDDTYVVVTGNRRYTYTTDLELIDTVNWNSLSSVHSYAYDPSTNFLELIPVENVLDSKFIGTTSFVLSTDGKLYKKSISNENYILIGNLSTPGTTFGIDPYDRIWVLHGLNEVSIFDSTANNVSDPIHKFSVGEYSKYDTKNISFICSYDRNTKSREWNCLIYFSSKDMLISPQLFVYDMQGLLIKIVDILSLFNLNQFNVLNQEQQKLNFDSKGDFTGYERKRVFNKLAPYNNKPQLILKASLKDKLNESSQFKTFRGYSTIEDWDSTSWNNIVVKLENKTFTLYENGIEKINFSYDGRYELSYETQPTLFIGTPVGSKYGFNKEIQCSSSIFNGRIESVKFYNYGISLQNLEMFLRASTPAQNLYWTLPTPMLQYIETVERMFKNKIPGSKSPYFNIKLRGSKIDDPQTRLIVEEEIREIVSKNKPVYAEFLKITWVESD